jgi:hypothetical protein
MVGRLVALSLLVGACSTTRHDPRVRDEPDTRRWFAGDLHMHVTPPDEPHEVRMALHEIAAAAREAELDFLVLTPHLYPNQIGDAYRESWREMAAIARSTLEPLMIPGVEWSTALGHFTVAGVDVAALDLDFLEAARRDGAFISVNHPFAVPTKIANIEASHTDLSYRAWTTPNELDTSALLDGAEVWNVPLALANVLSRPGGKSGEERAWLALDRLVHTQRRRATAVGGSDNHEHAVIATTWVLATDATEDAILDALRAGATCVGGTEAGMFRVHGDDGRWVRIGGEVRATILATLAWDGTARLFVDGVDRGEYTGGYIHATNGELHTYRIEVGASRCGFIYANL